MLKELAHELRATAIVDPRILLPRVHPERQRGIEGERRILADVVVARGLAALDRSVLDRVEHLQWRDDLPAAKMRISKRPSVNCDTRLAIFSAEPNSMSRLFGKLEAIRQRICACSCAAEAAPASSPLPTPVPAVARNCLLFTSQSPAIVMRSTRIEPHCREPRRDTSFPIATMPAKISFRLPAMVISSTG